MLDNPSAEGRIKQKQNWSIGQDDQQLDQALWANIILEISHRLTERHNQIYKYQPFTPVTTSVAGFFIEVCFMPVGDTSKKKKALEMLGASS